METTLKERIKKDYINAIKSKNVVEKNLLGVIIGEITTVEKNKKLEILPDSEIILIIKKIFKGIKEMIEKTNSIDSKLEFDIISKYMPTELSEDKLTEMITAIMNRTEKKEFGFIMGIFNKEYSNESFDNKLVAKIIKEQLQK